MAIPAVTVTPGTRTITNALKHRPDKVFSKNYSLFAESPQRERLFMPTPAGVPAVPKPPTFKPTTGKLSHWSNH